MTKLDRSANGRWRMRAIAVSIAVLLPLAAAAGDEKKPPPDGSEQKPKSPYASAVSGERGEARVYTNDDLKPYRSWSPPAEEAGTGRAGKTDPAKPGARTPSSADAERVRREEEAGRLVLQRMKAQDARGADTQRSVSEAEARVVLAEERVAELEKRLLAIRNPYLAPPQPPTEEKAKQAWDSMDGAERARVTEQQLDEARKELAAARKQLAERRARL